MAYNYKEMKTKLFTEENQKLFLAIRDRAFNLLNMAGVIKMGNLTTLPHGFSCVDNWEKMACVDRLVELGEIEEILYGDCAAHDRIFVKKKK